MGKKLGVLSLVLISLVAFVLSGCSMLSGKQKDAVEIYLKKRTVDEMLQAAQTALNESNYMQMSANYHIDMVDKDKSLTDKIVDAASWEFRAIRGEGSGYWKGMRTQGDNDSREEAYCVKKPDTKLYNVYKSNDGKETWVKEESDGLWSGLAIVSMDYSKFIGIEGLVLEKEPMNKDGKQQWFIHGNISYENARKLLGGLESSLGIAPDERLDTAEHVEVELYIDTDNRPVSLSIKFIPGSTLTKQFVYDRWEVLLKYSNYNEYSTMKVPKEVELAILTQEQDRKREDAFNVGGEKIEIETIAVETEESLEIGSETGESVEGE